MLAGPVGSFAALRLLTSDDAAPVAVVLRRVLCRQRLAGVWGTAAAVSEGLWRVLGGAGEVSLPCFV